ncbi:MAG: hypothetical protein ACXWC6_17670 [Ramlibacter sp.]
MPVFRSCPWALLLLGGALATGVGAQTAAPGESEARPPVPGQVLSDVQPLPAEDRDSTGALVLDQSRVRAQQQDSPPPPTRSGIKPIVGRDISRLVERTRDWDDVRDAQSADNPPGEASGAPADPDTPADAGSSAPRDPGAPSDPRP